MWAVGRGEATRAEDKRGQGQTALLPGSPSRTTWQLEVKKHVDAFYSPE